MRPPRIVKILSIEPFRITTLWTNGDVRVNDFSGRLDQFAASSRWAKLTDFGEFKQAVVGESDTLTWPNVSFPNAKGRSSPVTFDPDVLYAESPPADAPPVIEIDPQHEFTQADYARRKGLAPAKVRTWVKRGKLKSRYVPHLDLTLVVWSEVGAQPGSSRFSNGSVATTIIRIRSLQLRTTRDLVIRNLLCVTF